MALLPIGPIKMRPDGRAVDFQQAEQFRIELAFDRADRDQLAVGALIDIVEVRSGVEDVVASYFGLRAGAMQTVLQGCERCRAVDDGGVDHLPLAG